MQGLKVLVIEDEILVARDLLNLLEDWGYTVLDCCKTGAEAIEVFEQQIPDLVLADIQLKGDIDGIEATRRMTEIKPVPIIFISAQADFHTVTRAKAVQPAAYLLKPFNEQNLMISIELALSNFYQNAASKVEAAPAPAALANEVKLSADVLLKSGNYIFLKQNYRFQKYDIDDLLFLEADKNYTMLYFKQHKLAIRLPLQVVFERLSDFENIARVHRSYAVNIVNIVEFSESEIILPKQKLIPLTAAYKESFLEKFKVLW